jgi:hypothetical protein
MNAIKCPNCGNKMKAMSAPCKVTILAVDAQWRCPSCNVCGPSCREKNAHLAIRSAARLTREWIARMEAKMCGRAKECRLKNCAVVMNEDPFMLKIIDEFKPEVTPC